MASSSVDLSKEEAKNIRKYAIIDLFDSMIDPNNRYSNIVGDNIVNNEGTIDYSKLKYGTILYEALSNTPIGWQSIFYNSITDLANVSAKNDIDGEFLPPLNMVFNAFHLTPLDKVRVVIIGQDPYPQRGVAMGLSFSTMPGQRVPQSLHNIFREITRVYPTFQKPKDGCLVKWAQKGVLLLNASLTLTPGIPNSHGDRWMPFMNKVIKAIIETNKNVIFVMWGLNSQNITNLLGERVHQLRGPHPAARGKVTFSGCNHFLEINKLLVSDIHKELTLKLTKDPMYPINYMINSNIGVFQYIPMLLKDSRYSDIYKLFMVYNQNQEIQDFFKLPEASTFINYIYSAAMLEIDWQL